MKTFKQLIIAVLLSASVFSSCKPCGCDESSQNDNVKDSKNEVQSNKKTKD